MVEALGNTFFFDWEVALIVFLQNNMGKFGETLANFFSLFGEEMLMVAILGFLYWCYDKEFGKFVGMNLMVATVWNPMLKNICIRRRPYMDNPEIQCLRPISTEGDVNDVLVQGYSFPSGHSTAAAATYCSLPVYKKGKKWLSAVAIIITLFVGISRFCLGVHYPTDVLVGWAVGLLAVFLVPRILTAFDKKWKAYLILALIGLPGFFYCESTDYFTSYGMMIGLFLGAMFEEKYVRFENTRSVLHSILRLAGGVAIFFGLNTLLKLPFSSEFLADGSDLSHLVRCIRYMVVLFIDMGVYPMTFKLVKEKKKD